MSAAIVREATGTGRFAAHEHTGPETDLAPAPEAGALQETVRDFLEGSLPGFGFDVPEADLDNAVSSLVAALYSSHARA